MPRKYNSTLRLRRRNRRRKIGARVPKAKLKYALQNRNLYRFKRHSYLVNTMFSATTGGANGQSITNGADGMVLDTGNLNVSQYTYYSFCGTFKLNDLPDYTEFTALFDTYCIKGIQVKLIPFSTQSNIGQTVTVTAVPQNNAMFIHSCIDTNDLIPITASGAGVNLMRERPSYRVANAFNRLNAVAMNRYAKPGVALSAYSTGGADYITKKGAWCLTSSPDIDHYAHKWIIECYSPNAAINNVYILKAEVTYYLSFKDVI